MRLYKIIIEIQEMDQPEKGIRAYMDNVPEDKIRRTIANMPMELLAKSLSATIELEKT